MATVHLLLVIVEFLKGYIKKEKISITPYLMEQTQLMRT